MNKPHPFDLTPHVSEKITFALDTELAAPARLLYAKAAGDVAFKLPDGSTIVRTLAAKESLDKYLIATINTTNTTIASPTSNIELFR